MCIMLRHCQDCCDLFEIKRNFESHFIFIYNMAMWSQIKWKFFLESIEHYLIRSISHEGLIPPWFTVNVMESIFVKTLSGVEVEIWLKYSQPVYCCFGDDTWTKL